MNLPNTIEPGLVERCRRGDAEAFDVLYDHFGDRVWRLCYRMVGNHADAEDLAQEVWVSVWQQIGAFRCECAFATWLYRVASNTCLMWLRSNRKKATSPPDENAAAVTSTPESEALCRQELDDVLCALAQMPGSLRLPLVLRVNEGLTYAQIAEALECTTAAVKMRISRARAALAEALREEVI